MIHRFVRLLLSLSSGAALLFSCSSALVWAQASGSIQAESSENSLRGYPKAEADAERQWEAKFRSIPKAGFLREYMRTLSAEPHHVGSPGDRQNAQFILDKFRSWGLDAHIEEFDVLFPTPKERVLELILPETYKAQLKEPAIVEDPDSSDANQLPTYNAYSADGDVTAQLVYVNYGIPADYEDLEKLGVSVKGKIVIARYGASWRGIKPKVAYEHGAVGCIIYSDPKDDGYFQGDVYPEGPYRPLQGVQRGSVADMPVYPGDPLTPGYGATKDAKRLSLSEAETLMKIPVLPVSYGDALPLLKNLRGAVAPESWRGALPVTYHVGPGTATVHLKLSFDWSLKTIYNVVAKIEGSTYPDEWIIRGNHHDGWVNGASDPISRQVVMMEEARACAELLKQGWKPKRTIVFAAWDGEEPGLLGSTEWVELHAKELSEKAVVYINTDSTGAGTLGISGSHSLEKFVNDIAREVQDPKTGKSLLEAMRERAIERASGEKEKKEARERRELPIGALGSGSDYTAFLDHLGIASLNTSIGGDGGGGVYHSIYDTFAWYTRFSDTTFQFGRALAQYNGTAVLRLADAEVLPFEFTALAETVSKYADEIEKLQKQVAPPTPIDLGPLKSGLQSLRESASRFEEVIQAASAGDGQGLRKSATTAKALNRAIYLSERSLIAAQGLPRRGWFKHQLYAPGFYTGYGVKTIPAVREALEQKYWDEARQQAIVVGNTLAAAAKQIDAAAQLLGSK